MLILVFALLILGLLIGGALIISKAAEGDEIIGLGVALFVVGLAGALVLLVTGIAIPINNLGKAASLEAFYRANAENYAAAVEETENVLTVSLEHFEALIPVQGSIEKLDVGATVGARIAEWRDSVNAYNTRLQKFRTYDKSLWLGIYFPTMSEELKPIVIGP